MDFKTWLKDELATTTEAIAKEKAALKDLKAEKKLLEKEKAVWSHLPISKTESKINDLKGKLGDLKRLQRVEVARLQTGKVIALSTLKAFNKKISGRTWLTTITQHPDGLKLAYTEGNAKGELTITGFGVDVKIPAEVELPIYSEGEVLECLIQS